MNEDSLRKTMVDQQLIARGIHDLGVLKAMRQVPRHLFVPEGQREWAYADGPLPIGMGQTISQPFMVAYMTQCLRLKPSDRVLEIGTGCGYQTAVLAQCCSQVLSLEILRSLLNSAQKRLTELGFLNIEFHWANGLDGLPEKAPFDGILIAAAAQDPPLHLLEQLAEDRVMVCPEGTFHQELVCYTKKNGSVERETQFPVRFVPLLGDLPH